MVRRPRMRTSLIVIVGSIVGIPGLALAQQGPPPGARVPPEHVPAWLPKTGEVRIVPLEQQGYRLRARGDARTSLPTIAVELVD
jgi:hypothetical protein